MKNLIYALLLFLVGQSVIWFQINGQFVWPLFRKYEWVLVLSGIPISLLYLSATRYGVEAFDGLLWPQRFLAFACGIFVFSIFAWLFKGEGFTIKTIVSLALSLTIVVIQVFWK